MGPHGYQLLLLLLDLFAPGLPGLPTTVSMMRNAEPGMAIAEFNVTCRNGSSPPTLALQSVPLTSSFNLSTVARQTSPEGLYSVQITLSRSAVLDAQQANQYTLSLEATCSGEPPASTQLFMQVRRVDGPPQCMDSFTSQVGESVQVPEDVAPLTPIYTVVLRQWPASGLRFSIEDNDTPFTINSAGQVLAPRSGFTPTQADQTFRLQILVMDSTGRNCTGDVRVLVRSHHPRVKFTEAWRSVAVLEKQGPLQLITQVQAQGNNVRYEIVAPAAHRLYTLHPMTGELRNTDELDVHRSPEVAHTQLLVRAYDVLHPSNSATMGLNITVLPVHTLAPRCSPALFLAQVPEDTPIGRTLVTLTCTDPDASNSSFRYQVEGDQHSLYSFRMQGPALQVNATLDYDSAASASFQYVATILVTDSGQPPQTTCVPVMVTVTARNEHPPTCPANTIFHVPEDAAFGDIVGRVNGMDRDFPFDSIEYGIVGGTGTSPPAFSIGPRTGEIYVLGPLDYESRKSYQLTVRLRDVANDADPWHQRTALCLITLLVQDANDQPPRCTPPFQELFIYSTRDPSLPLAQLQCSDADESTVPPLTYNLVGGNAEGHFRLAGSTLRHSAFSYPPDSAPQPRTFELLVEVTDSLSAPRHSTTATLVIHVAPLATSTPSTTTVDTTLQREPQVETRTAWVWAPPPWFVVVLTVSAALLLATLVWLAWLCLCRPVAGEPAQPLLQDRAWSDPHTEEKNTAPQQPSKETRPASVFSLHEQFDGRAQDPITGQDYLFNSRTGARCWL